MDAYAINATGGYGLIQSTFNDAHRYVDWILTVPLLMVELVAVLGLPKKAGGCSSSSPSPRSS